MECYGAQSRGQQRLRTGPNGRILMMHMSCVADRPSTYGREQGEGVHIKYYVLLLLTGIQWLWKSSCFVFGNCFERTAVCWVCNASSEAVFLFVWLCSCRQFLTTKKNKRNWDPMAWRNIHLNPE